MQNRYIPPYSDSNIPGPQVMECSPTTAADNLATPTSPPTPQTSKSQASRNLTQDEVEANLQLKRRQQDLLVLTSLNDNSSLHWRPSWFKQVLSNDSFWTLHNPPNVVTERLPRTVSQNKDYYTRRMRRHGDRPPLYIKTWYQWNQYCDLYGVPLDFLSEHQIDLMRLGLPRTESGDLCAPPAYPLYPEPQPLGHRHYILDPSIYATHLPAKFHSINDDVKSPEDVKVVAVHPDGRLTTERKDEMPKYHTKRTLFDGQMERGDNSVYETDSDLPKQQGLARRWTYVPWSSEQEESCKPPSLVVKLKVGRRRKFETIEDDRTTGVAPKTEEKKPKRRMGNRMLRELQ